MTDGSLTGNVRGWLTDGRLTVAGTVLVVTIGVVLAVRTVEIRDVIGAVAGADPALLGAGLVVYISSWPLRGLRYSDVLGVMDRACGVRFLTSTIFVSQTMNLVVPARAGDGVRAYLLKERRGVPYSVGGASLAVERVLDLIAITLLGGGAITLLVAGGWTAPSGSPVTAGPVLAGLGGLVVCTSVAAVALARSNLSLAPAVRARMEGSRLSRLGEAVVRFGASIRVVAASPRAIGILSLESLAVWGLDVLTAILVLAALLGVSPALSVASLLVVGTLAVSAGNLAKVVPLSQGGVGLYEAAFTGVLVGVAPVSVEVAIAAAVLDHALKNLVTLLGGGGAALFLNVSPVSPEEAERSDPGSAGF